MVSDDVLAIMQKENYSWNPERGQEAVQCKRVPVAGQIHLFFRPIHFSILSSLTQDVHVSGRVYTCNLNTVQYLNVAKCNLGYM